MPAGPRRRRGAALLLPLAAVVAAAGCGGSGGADSATAPATAPAASVRVTAVDGDTGRPLAGARVVAVRDGRAAAPVRAGGDGTAEVPEGTQAVRVLARGHDPAIAKVRGAPVTVRAFDPSLQSPEYGGGPSRTRYVPGVVGGRPGSRPAWAFEAPSLIEFPPAVDDGLVVFGVNSGRVYALDARTGRVRWARIQKGEIASTPAIAGDRVLVSSMDGRVTAYRRAGGRPLWSWSSGGSPIESSPLVHEGLVYVGAWNGTLSAIDVATGRTRWTYHAPGEIKGSVALAGPNVVVGDYAGHVHALDARTGALRWSFDGGRRFYGGPGVSGGLVVIGDVGGAVIALDARTGAERWRHSTGGAYVYSSPAIAGGRVFIGNYGGTFQALDLATGALRWSFDAGERISGSATVVDGTVYTAVLYQDGAPRHTYGLDVRTGRVVYRGDDGRYSPAVGAGATLYLVGTRTLTAHRATP